MVQHCLDGAERNENVIIFSCICEDLSKAFSKGWYIKWLELHFYVSLTLSIKASLKTFIPSFSVIHAENLHVEGLVHDGKWLISHKLMLVRLEQSTCTTIESSDNAPPPFLHASIGRGLIRRIVTLIFLLTTIIDWRKPKLEKNDKVWHNMTQTRAL